jgi:hypothetical protein
MRQLPAACGKLGWGHLDLHQLLRFGEGGGRDLRSNRRRGAEGRRRAGSLLLRWILRLAYDATAAPSSASGV